MSKHTYSCRILPHDEMRVSPSSEEPNAAGLDFSRSGRGTGALCLSTSDTASLARTLAGIAGLEICETPLPTPEPDHAEFLARLLTLMASRGVAGSTLSDVETWADALGVYVHATTTYAPVSGADYDRDFKNI